MIFGHGGNITQVARRLGCQPAEIFDMSSNINPLGPPPGLMAFLERRLIAACTLPEVDAGRAVRAFADRYGVAPETVVAGNGTTQIIYGLPQALGIEKAMIVGPTYADYADACRIHRAQTRFLMADSADDFIPDLHEIDRLAPGVDAVFICNPNNPTGVLIPAAKLRALCSDHPRTVFIVDEAYLPFAKTEGSETLMGCGLDNVVVLHSMSKIFRIPGLRVGFAVGSPSMKNRLAPFMPPWGVNALAQASVRFLMKRPSAMDAFVASSRSFLEAEKRILTERLAPAVNIRLFQSQTAFVLARLSGGLVAETVCRALLKDRILIRDCGNFPGLGRHFVRMSLKTAACNRLLADKLLALDRKTGTVPPSLAQEVTG